VVCCNYEGSWRNLRKSVVDQERNCLVTLPGFHGAMALGTALADEWKQTPVLNLHFPKRVAPGRPMMGAPLKLRGLAYEPVNEMGVVFLFGMVAARLGFRVEALQMSFPDCEAKLEVEPGRWQHMRIEFEYESRKFRDHRHDPEKCDMIVCWRHNWAGCPERIQVVELGKIVGSPRSRVILPQKIQHPDFRGPRRNVIARDRKAANSRMDYKVSRRVPE
jgi:hypothetical protein